MLDALFLIAIGTFIGWNFPQPFYAKWAQEWVVNAWKNFTQKTEK